MDLISDLGHLALASRLKRLGDRLQEAVSELYSAQQVSFRARWFPLLAALARESPLSISQLGAIVGLTHTAIAQISSEMEAAGLVASASDPRDGRRRTLGLTAEGLAVLGQLQPLWTAIERATAELVAESGHDLLGAVAAVEERLEARGAADRLRAALESRTPNPKFEEESP
jgi:DNA-binding MarR family transcriptional regulator